MEGEAQNLTTSVLKTTPGFFSYKGVYDRKSSPKSPGSRTASAAVSIVHQ